MRLSERQTRMDDTVLRYQGPPSIEARVATMADRLTRIEAAMQYLVQYGDLLTARVLLMETRALRPKVSSTRRRVIRRRR